jgi:hypothetical protein
MLTFRLYLAEMSRTKRKAIQQIENKQNTIIKHLMYLVLIKDEREVDGWIKEIINYLVEIYKNTKLKPKNKRLHKDIYFEHLYNVPVYPLDVDSFKINKEHIINKYDPKKVYFKKYNIDTVEKTLKDLYTRISNDMSNNTFIDNINKYKKELLDIANKELI